MSDSERFACYGPGGIVPVMNAYELANQQFEEHLRRNRYPGRGLVIGRSDAEDAWLQVYWIMGRSPGSQARRFVAEGATLRTEPTAEAGGDRSLLVYEAMLELPGWYLVSNGDQTRTLAETLAAGGTFEAAQAKREREPDGPHYTPRITGLLTLDRGEPSVTLGILKASPVDPALTDRFSYRPAAPAAGLGFGLTTYAGDGNPLPSFRGDPLMLPCRGTAQAVLDAYWEALNPEYRVALAVKRIPANGGAGTILVRNRVDR